MIVPFAGELGVRLGSFQPAAYGRPLRSSKGTINERHEDQRIVTRVRYGGDVEWMSAGEVDWMMVHVLVHGSWGFLGL